MIKRIADSPTDPDAEGSDELDGEEVVVAPHSVGHPSSNSSSQPLANRFQSQVIPSTPKTLQPALASIPTTLPPDSPSPSHSRPALNQAVRPSPIQQPRKSPITTCQQLQPMASSSRRRDGLSPLQFPAAQVLPSATTTKLDPPPWVLRQFQPGTKLGPIGHTISFMANWSPFVLYGHLTCHRGSSGNTRVAWHSAIRELTWKTPKNKEIK
ncbi:hypothetical protein O181_106000 [Austropuccinia psidii MF-1]|uniref:Uncharacterized protein n=1 Tax=Austropuccinia psidii MF-1 TaxID=1389203 RepID=A0A9Q3PM79_9BASI|nr:hypothetical protein [Austropuccinia psidii MF-1]